MTRRPRAPVAWAGVMVVTIVFWSEHLAPLTGPTVGVVAGVIAVVLAPGFIAVRVLRAYSVLDSFDRIAVAFVLGLLVWAVSGAAGFVFATSLDAVIWMAAGATCALAGIAVIRPRTYVKAEPAPPSTVSTAAIILLACAGALVQNFRGIWERWDYYSYIAFVRRALVEPVVSPAHAWYAGEGPDPIHSYDVLAVTWAAVCRVTAVDPIAAYLSAAPVTMIVAVLAFRFLVKRIVRTSLHADIAMLLFIAYHVIYGGFVFIGRAAVYPDDTAMLILYPVATGLVLLALRGKQDRVLVIILAALAAYITVVHVLWGLLVAGTLAATGVFLLAMHVRIRSDRSGRDIFWTRRSKTALILCAIPLLAGLAIPLFGRRDQLAYASPDAAMFDVSNGLLYAGILFTIPVVYAVWVLIHNRSALTFTTAARVQFRKYALIVFVTVLALVPVAFLRMETTGEVAEQYLNRHPYRAFVTPDLFVLNPIGPTYGSPNLTMWPLLYTGAAVLPFVLRKRRRSVGAWLGAFLLLDVALITAHPLLATLWSDLFSMGYLRRLVRLGGVWGTVLTAVAFAYWAQARWGHRKERAILLRAAGVCTLASMACIPWTVEGDPYYNRLLERTVAVVRETPRNTLPYHDPVFGWIRDNIPHNTVIMSDAWTSYRLSAYAPVYVVARFKGGTGVGSQQHRRDAQHTFFLADTDQPMRRRILDEFTARYVLVNDSQSYTSRGATFGAPDVRAALERDPQHFRIVVRSGAFTLFKYAP